MIYETDTGGIIVMRQNASFVVFRPSPSGTHLASDSAYRETKAGLSLAIARADYLACPKIPFRELAHKAVDKAAAIFAERS